MPDGLSGRSRPRLPPVAYDPDNPIPDSERGVLTAAANEPGVTRLGERASPATSSPAAPRRTACSSLERLAMDDWVSTDSDETQTSPTWSDELPSAVSRRLDSWRGAGQYQR